MAEQHSAAKKDLAFSPFMVVVKFMDLELADAAKLLKSVLTPAWWRRALGELLASGYLQEKEAAIERFFASARCFWKFRYGLTRITFDQDDPRNPCTCCHIFFFYNRDRTVEIWRTKKEQWLQSLREQVAAVRRMLEDGAPV